MTTGNRLMKNAVWVGALWMIGLVGCTGPEELETAAAGNEDPVTVREFTLPVSDSVSLGGIMAGTDDTGVPIVILHGGPGMDHQYLRPLIDSLALDRTVIAPDQRGTGGSEAPLTPDAISFDALIDDIERVREWVGSETVDIVGHSWGTAMAYHYALRHPDRVRRMVLVAPVEPGTRFQQASQERRAARMDSSLTARLAEIQGSQGFQTGDPETIRRFYSVVFRPLLHDPAMDFRVPLADRSVRNGFAVMGALQPSMPDPDLWPRLAEIRAPTLVVHGRADAYPAEMAEELVAELKDGSLLIIEEAGHFPYIESPAAFYPKVRAFLGSGEGS